MCRYLKLLYILFILQQFIIFYKVNSVLYNFINSNFQQEALTVNLTWHKRSISSQSPSDGLWESKFRFFNQEEIRFCYTVLPSQAKKKSVIFKQKQQRLKSQWGRIQCTVCHSVHSDCTYTVGRTFNGGWNASFLHLLSYKGSLTLPFHWNRENT